MNLDPTIQLALRHHQSGHTAEAEKLLRQLLTRRPNNPQAMQLLGQIAHLSGRNAEAVELMRRVLKTDPKNPFYHGNLGAVLAAGGQFAEAEVLLKDAIRLKPDFVEGYSNLGNILLKQGKTEDATSAYRTAARLRPGAPESYYNLGAALHRARRPDDAIAAYQKALSLKPDYADAHNNLGSLHSENGRVDQGVAEFRETLRINPRHVGAMNNLAAALQEKGEVEEAVAIYRQALSIQPDPRVAANLIVSLHLLPQDDPAAIRAEVDRWNRTYARPLAPLRRPVSTAPDPEKRVRVGYVSRDFNRAPVGRFIVPLLSRHDHAGFEIFAYSDVTNPDPVTDRLKSSCDHWRDTSTLTDVQLADAIRADGIDILVDLGMHTKDSRILVFAMKPAPLQLSYLAYCSTTGLETIDYRITDVYLDPPDRDPALYSEESIRLTSYWCYAPPAEAPQVVPPPSGATGKVTFGCLNNFCKISHPAFDTWCDVLKVIPNSRLMLHALEGTHRSTALDRITAAGIDPGRIDFVNRLPVAQYFRQYHQIDIALDPFPYPGGTTSCDALWMGVPLVTLAGRSAVARGGVSILSNIGLPDLIATNREDYVRVAARLAADGTRLAELRSSLRDRMRRSPLMDSTHFTREIESAFREIWRGWCATHGSVPVASGAPEAHYNRALELRDAGDFRGAIRAYEKAVELRPDFVEAWNNLGTLLKKTGRAEEAVGAFRRAIELRPTDVEPRFNLGNALAESENTGQAVEAYRSALALNQDAAHVIAALGNSCRDAAEIKQALHFYQQSLALIADPDVASNFAYTHYLDSSSRPADILAAHRAWDRRFAQPLAPQILLQTNDRSPHRRIRIGYVSPDFSLHPVGRFIHPLLSRHDHNAFEVFCYSDGSVDDLTARLRSTADTWRDTSRLSHAQLADQIRADGIDVLVDLAMHTRNNRLLTFARKPAPVQVSYLAYCGTTGLSAIDYRLTDPYLDPPGQGDEFYSEKSIRLPRTYWCFQSLDMMPEVQAPPALSAGHTTFGYLGTFAKAANSINAWLRILQSVSRSRLLLQCPRGPHRDRLLESAAAVGIPADRIEFVTRVPLEQYFNLFSRIDISLDTLHCSGATTICDSLWMGVPVITVHDPLGTAMARSGLSVLSNAGLPELVAHDADQYVQLAVNLAGDLPRLERYRNELRSRMSASPLMDAARFARDVESAIRMMWRTRCEVRL